LSDSTPPHNGDFGCQIALLFLQHLGIISADLNDDL
jgi:hypothetical protein